MEIVKDIDQHTVCTADPFRGLIVRKTKRDNIMIYQGERRGLQDSGRGDLGAQESRRLKGGQRHELSQGTGEETMHYAGKQLSGRSYQVLPESGQSDRKRENG